MDKTKFFTPTKIKNFLNCKYIVYNEFYKKDLGISKKQKTKNVRVSRRRLPGAD